MDAIFRTILTCTLTMSVVALAMLLLSPTLSRRYRPRSLYIAWIIILLAFALPYRPQIVTPPVTVEMPSRQITLGALPEGLALPNAGAPQAQTPAIATPSPARTLGTMEIAGIIWAAGAVIVLSVLLYRHFRFMRTVRRWRKDIDDPRIHATLFVEKLHLGITRDVAVRKCAPLDSPMLVGFLHPQILLPDLNLSDTELSLVLRHELVHLKRGDLWVRALQLVVTAMHWFNPLLYFVRRAVTFQCEAACDAEVTRDADLDARQVYSETIISVIRRRTQLHTALSTNYTGGIKSMKRRILSIMDTRRKKLGALLVTFAMVASVGLGMSLALTSASATGAPGDGVYAAGDAVVFNNPDAFATPLLSVSTLSDLDYPIGIYVNGTPATVVSVGDIFARVMIGGDGITDGVSGSVQKEYLSADTGGNVTLPSASLIAAEGQQIPIRIEYSEDSAIAFELPADTQVATLGLLDGWYHITSDLGTGFVKVENVELSKDTDDNFDSALPGHFDNLSAEEKKAMDADGAYYTERVAQYGEWDTWPLQVKADYAAFAISIGRGQIHDYGIDIMPGADDLTEEQALSITYDAIVENFNISREQVEAMPYTVNFLDVNYEWTGHHWFFYFQRKDNVYLSAVVSSPAGEVVDLYANTSFNPATGVPDMVAPDYDKIYAAATSGLMQEQNLTETDLAGYEITATSGMTIGASLTDYETTWHLMFRNKTNPDISYFVEVDGQTYQVLRVVPNTNPNN